MTPFPRLSKGDLVVLDLETRDPLLMTHGPGWCYRKQGYIVGVAAAWEGGSAYWPVRHEGEGNVPLEGVQRWVRGVVRAGARVVMHNALYDRGWLRTWDIEEEDWTTPHEDTLTLAALQWEYRRSYSLANLAVEFGVQEKRTDLLDAYARAQGWKGHAGSHLWRMPAEVVAPYAVADAEGTWGLYAKLLPFMRDEGWEDAYRKEIQLQDCLLAMRARGVRVSAEEVERATAQLERKMATAQAALGAEVQVWSAASVARGADARGLAYPRTAAGAPSFRSEWLRDQKADYWAEVLALRVASKADGTFVRGLMDKVVDGRVHAQFHPLRSDEGGAVTGRFSSTDPNLQNQPAKVKWLKALIRGLFLPEEGQQWAALDYSQQEPRQAVHFAVRVGARGGRSTAELYRTDPRTDFHTLVAELAGITRDKAKVLNLAMMYGQGEASTCHALGYPTEAVVEDGRTYERAGPEGRAFIENYHERVPFVRGLNEECKRRAKSRGWIKTLNGRRCRFGGEGGAYPYTAMNRLVQGSSADQTKAAMMALHAEGYHVMVTVHDEVGVSVGSVEEARAAARVMEGCVELEVPSVVDVEIGPSWGAAVLPGDE